MTKLEEIMTDANEHRLRIREVWPFNENLSPNIEDEMVGRFIKTFYPQEYKEYFE